MRALGRALGVDLRRSLLSGAFFLTVALMLAWMCFNSAHYLFNPAMWSQISAPKMLFIATCTSLGLAPLLFAIATVPYAWSFLQDRESGFENQAVERVGFWAYGFAKVLSVALSAFLAAAVSIGLFVGRFSCWVCRKLSPPWKGETGLAWLCSLRPYGGVLPGADYDHGPQLQLGLGLWPYDDGHHPECLCGAAGASGGILFVLGSARGCEPCDPLPLDYPGIPVEWNSVLSALRTRV